MAYGTVTIGRLVLRETFGLQATVDASNGQRGVSFSGEESVPPLTLVQLKQRQEDLMGLRGMFLPVIFTDKSDHNGYYTVADVTTDVTNWNSDPAKFAWTIKLVFHGTEDNVDIESRLTGIARQNNFSSTGEKWHSPSIGHYGYYTGSTLPSRMTRIGEEGTHVVFRDVPSGVNPRWGCDADDYMTGRVKVLVNSVERSGSNIAVSATSWELNNGLVKVTPNSGNQAYLNVASWSSGSSSWKTKAWRVFPSVSNVITTIEGVTVLRNDPEMVTIRLVKNLADFGDAAGRATIDLTLRRGSRFVEGYMQRGDSTSEMKIALTPLENATNSSSGYVVATSNDADGNKFVIGTTKNYSAHSSGGIIKTNSTFLDFFIGSVVGGSAAVSGDTAADLYDQYIASMAENTMGVRR